MNRKIAGTLLVAAGAAVAYRNWDAKIEKAELKATGGASGITWKALGVLGAIGGLYLIFKKND